VEPLLSSLSSTTSDDFLSYIAIVICVCSSCGMYRISAASFEIPTMKRMTKLFNEELQSKGDQKEKEVYHTIVNELEKDFGENNIDIETIFSVINGLREYSPFSISPLSLYASRFLFGKSLLDNKIWTTSVSRTERSIRFDNCFLHIGTITAVYVTDSAQNSCGFGGILSPHVEGFG
jgi:hypothetical protein